MEYAELLKRLTVDCKDDGKQFRKKDRIHEIKALLENSGYELLGDLMLRGELDESVLVAFTGDEEKDSAGAIEIMQMLGRMECLVGKALVLDVTNEGWEDEAAFSIENDHGFDIITGYHIVELLQASGTSCVFVHEAEPDETWEYSKGSSSDLPGIPCLSLCLPVCGNMHGDDGVLLRKSSVIPYEDILRNLANAGF